jgi:hypothetical protein
MYKIMNMVTNGFKKLVFLTTHFYEILPDYHFPRSVPIA